MNSVTMHRLGFFTHAPAIFDIVHKLYKLMSCLEPIKLKM